MDAAACTYYLLPPQNMCCPKMDPCSPEPIGVLSIDPSSPFLARCWLRLRVEMIRVRVRVRVRLRVGIRVSLRLRVEMIRGSMGLR